VVPGRETYDDWKGIKGLGLAGGASFFPHMTNQWVPLINEKQAEFLAVPAHKELYCLRDIDVCCVDGSTSSISVLSAPSRVESPAVE
jgi:hypothetical protein